MTSSEPGSARIIKEIGRGSYGVIYESEIEGANEKHIAIKRNLIEKHTDFNGSIRELEMLKIFNNKRSHPCLVTLTGVALNSPFRDPLPPIEDDSLKDDKVYFLMEQASCDLITIIEKQYPGYQKIKIIMFQLLLGVEYMHSKKIMHRDLKPGNILWNDEQKFIKIADFGFSKYDFNQAHTPRIQTSWYRSPEVIWGDSHYGTSIDIWSLGCMFYELVTRNVLFPVEDNDSEILQAILRTVPELPDENMIKSVAKFHKCRIIDQIFIPTRNIPLKKKLALSDEQVNEFNKEPGYYSDFLDLLGKMLIIFPEKRISATEAIKHKFFAKYMSWAEKIRVPFAPFPETGQDNKIKVIECAERKRAINNLFAIFEDKKKLKWFRTDTVFHALEIYDRFIDHEKKRGKIDFYHNVGFDTKEENMDYNFLICIYLSHKRMETSELALPFTDLLPPKKREKAKKNYDKLEAFETYVLQEVLDYIIFKKTPYEYLTQQKKSRNESYGFSTKKTTLFIYGLLPSCYIDFFVIYNMVEELKSNKRNMSRPQIYEPIIEKGCKNYLL